MIGTPPSPTQWTTRSLLAWMTDAFTRAALDSPRLMAEMLLAHALGLARLDLYTATDRPASEEERTRLRALVARALRHEPVQYLVGEAWFFSLSFKADKRALIPRPSTETLVETVLQDARRGGAVLRTAPETRTRNEETREEAMAGSRSGSENRSTCWIADVCIGSGAIAVSLLKNLPGARCIGADISGDALALARENAERHGVHTRLDLLRGDLIEPIREWAHQARGDTGGNAGDERTTSRREFLGFDYLCANPPYIPDEEWPAVPPNVKGQEPEIALRGGAEGLRFVAPLIEQSPALLRPATDGAPGGMLLIEIAMSSADRVLGLAQANAALTGAKVLNDADGLPRVLVAVRT